MLTPGVARGNRLSAFLCSRRIELGGAGGSFIFFQGEQVMVRPARVQSSQQVALQLMRFDDVYWIPPLRRFARRVWQRIGERCRRDSTKSGVAIALDAVRGAQQEDIAAIAEAISLPARYCARQFRLEEHELANQTLIEVLPTIRKHYKP